jgi:hypothetical protein
MPLRRRTKGEAEVFNGVEPNRLFEVFVNRSTEPNARDAWIFRSRYGRRKFATLSFTSSRDAMCRAA